MAFNEEVEELEFNSVFNDDDEEVYEDVSEFGEYTDEEMSERWGNLSFEDLVFELENILAASKKYFFSKTKRVINAEEMTNLAKHITAKLPGEISEAKDIIATREKIITGARREADAIRKDADTYRTNTVNDADAQKKQIIAGAQAQAKQMVSEHEITRLANAEREKIIADAKARGRAIVDKAKADADAYIAEVTTWGNENLDGINQYIAGVLGSARDSYIKSVKGIDEAFANYKAANDQRVSSLRKVPTFKPTSNGGNNNQNQ
ncbi:MAG: hypothetical protein IJ262_03230 [Clostridia bacterium]|nr:hypothetical protein [Clostridia bacterium]